jgi:hypothetical protein
MVSRVCFHTAKLTGDEPITRKLTPARDHRAQPKPVPIRRGRKDALKVPELAIAPFERDGRFDLLHFELDDGGLDIACGRVVLGENVDGAVPVSAGVEPPGRLFDEEDTDDVDDCRSALEVEAGPPGVVGEDTAEGDGDALDVSESHWERGRHTEARI